MRQRTGLVERIEEGLNRSGEAEHATPTPVVRHEGVVRERGRCGMPARIRVENMEGETMGEVGVPIWSAVLSQT